MPASLGGEALPWAPAWTLCPITISCPNLSRASLAFLYEIDPTAAIKAKPKTETAVWQRAFYDETVFACDKLRDELEHDDKSAVFDLDQLDRDGVLRHGARNATYPYLRLLY